MASSKEAQRRQRRRELDARRSKLRVRLSSWPESWSKLKDQLGFSQHSELAHFLVDSYSCRSCSSGSGDGKNVISVSVASLDRLILLVHRHSRQCPLIPNLQLDPRRQEVKDKPLEEDPEASEEAEPCLTYVCDGGHELAWRPAHTERNGDGEKSAASSGPTTIRQQQPRKGIKQEVVCRMRSRRSGADGSRRGNEAAERLRNSVTAQHEQDAALQEGSDALHLTSTPDISRDSVQATVPIAATRGCKRTGAAPAKGGKESSRRCSGTDEVSQTSSSRKRKARPTLMLPCEFDGCWRIFSSRQYLNHHMKYQHFQQKTFSCSHPKCGKSFNFKKHLKEHEKLHSDQRDYICEFCARAFRTSSNLSIHRRIHTGEKPLQCEVCGFTCRQKASLNWHMRKHDAESSYRFACEICGRRFEKRDNVTAHQSKSHADHVTSDLPEELTPSDL